MRDIALVLIFIGFTPAMLKRPSLGVVMWIWFSVMNPHRLTYGFAFDLQFALATALVTFLGLLFTKEERRLEPNAPTILLIVFAMWMSVTSVLSIHGATPYEVEIWSRVMKIFLMTVVALTVIHDKRQIHWVVWIIVFSLGFYGTKGGFFTIVTGGNYLVWGPSGTYIDGNNELALALVMVIPLMRYVQMQLPKRWQKNGMSAVMALSAFAAIGSHSRGALVAIAAMAVVLWWKSRSKLGMGIVLCVAGVLLIMFMPAEWMERMNTIKTYDEDASALGRINAWWMAFNLASDRLFGGGFDIYDLEVFGRYAPIPTDVHAAHSIYFQTMAEHGFIGLLLYMSIGATTWFTAGQAKKKAIGNPSLAWAGQLMDMIKVSMVGYGVGGAFLSLAYFDVPYYLIVLAVATRTLVVRTQKQQAATVREKDGRSGRHRFGGVVLDDDGVEVPAPRPRALDWRGQGAYSVSNLAGRHDPRAGSA